MAGKKKTSFITGALAIAALSFFLRFYTIGKDMPFFYHEDEGHHFNRTVNMAKSGDMNPHYFNKPSLHFYLRIPVVWISYFWNKHKGHINSIQEIRTYNRYGLSRFEYTASHPGIVKWNRALSVLWGVLTVVLTFMIALRLFSSRETALAAGLFSALSPPLIEHSGIVGVDMLMTVMCMASVYCAVLAFEHFTVARMSACAIFAGLAVSSKYNALPVAVMPLLVTWLTGNLRKKTFLIACLLPAAAFFAASPYILLSFSEFRKGIGYEVWHYAVAGHEGHSGERGWDQIAFYTRWFRDEATGILILLFAAAGLAAMPFAARKKFLVLAAFPLLFFTEMILQKVNFTRNMIVVIPFLSILGAWFAHMAATRLNFSTSVSKYIFCILTLLMAWKPFELAQQARAAQSIDTRRELESWFRENNDPALQTAAAGQLLLTPAVRTQKNVHVINQQESDPLLLYLEGFDRLIFRGGSANESFPGADLLRADKHFEGTAAPQRIVINPDIRVYSFSDEIKKFSAENVSHCPSCEIGLRPAADGKFECPSPAAGSREDYCWINHRVTRALFTDRPDFSRNKSKTGVNITFSIMSPWADQEFMVYKRNMEPVIVHKFSAEEAGKWISASVTLAAADLPEKDLLIGAKTIRSPSREGLGPDKRRLGLALRDISISDLP